MAQARKGQRVCLSPWKKSTGTAWRPMMSRMNREIRVLSCMSGPHPPLPARRHATCPSPQALACRSNTRDFELGLSGSVAAAGLRI